jgi:hypothetical protein
MPKTKHLTIEEILSKTDDYQKPIAEKLRFLARNTIPNSEEQVRRERITFSINGRDFAGIRFTNKHVDLLFLHGDSLSSPQLKGQGTIGDPKHIEINNLQKFDETEAKRLLQEAAATVQAA